MEKEGRKDHMCQEKLEGGGKDGCGPWVCQWKESMGVSHGPDVGKQETELACDLLGIFPISWSVKAEET